MEVSDGRTEDYAADYFFAVILGLVLGFLVAIVRSSAVKSGIKKPAKIKEKGVYLGSCWAIICLSLWILSASFT